MQSLIAISKRHLLHDNSEALEKALDVLEVFTKTSSSREEKEYVVCRYNEVISTNVIDIPPGPPNQNARIKEELLDICGFAPDWGRVSNLLEEEVLEEEQEIYEHLEKTNAIWWETSEGMNYTFLPPRPLKSGDLQTRLLVSEGVCTIFDADGDAEVVEIERAHFALSAACKQRQNYEIASYVVEQLFASI
ncbi:hypothetical protein LAU_0034 [Lausannevirus]|uniref:Uncharacterized protein n=2 Tax=Lausannevirus TaxID=999883 RepID=A0A0N9PYR3_9VIRU|nr:hypothetical protein LAU_0034 [Lausannevirus]AEA06890.1 hypothetical protein LAU_0034 [Lausannevirus]ALH06732.1 hypothetical protein PMV_034 [Port-miou virus]